jgi:methionine-rich copper-binding protein CopC
VVPKVMAAAVRWWGVVAAVGLLGAGCAPDLAAAPRLIAAWPPDQAQLPIAAHTLELTFNRALQTESSWAAVWRDEDGSPATIEATMEQRRLEVRLLEPAAGHYRLHWHTVAARTAAAADGEQDFSLQDESDGAPRIDVSQATADSGERVEIKGTGFDKASAVKLTIGDDSQALNSVVTDVHGSFGVDVRIPPGVPFGMQPVTAVDASGSVATTALQVRWGGWPPVLAFNTGQPGPGPDEVTFSVSVRNRSDFVLERVRIVLDDPDGASFVAAEPMAERQGQAVRWEIPMLDRGVAGPWRATYRATAATTSHARIEFRHRRPRGCPANDCPPAFVSETTSDSTPVYPAD